MDAGSQTLGAPGAYPVAAFRCGPVFTEVGSRSRLSHAHVNQPLKYGCDPLTAEVHAVISSAEAAERIAPRL